MRVNWLPPRYKSRVLPLHHPAQFVAEEKDEDNIKMDLREIGCEEENNISALELYPVGSVLL
jgi:hypothetical protein